MDPNIIVAELLCSISNALPLDPVVADDGCIYERSEIADGRVVYPLSKIKRVIELLVSSGNVDAKYLGGWVKRIAKAPSDFSLVKANAETGDVSSMVELGEIYMKGIGVEKDEVKGYHWFNAASDLKSELGTVRKADCLIAGLGTPHTNEARNEGLRIPFAAPAMLRLARLRLWCYYSEGIGVNPDRKKAAKWLNRLKKSYPELSDEDLRQKKRELMETIGAPKPCSPIAVIAPKDDSCDKPAPHKETTHFKHENENEVDPKQASPLADQDQEVSCIDAEPGGHDVPPATDGRETSRETSNIGRDANPQQTSKSIINEGETQSMPSESADASYQDSKESPKKNQDEDGGQASAPGCTPVSIQKNEATQENDANANCAEKDAASPSPVGTVCKQCYTCHQFKPNNAFSAAQWKQPAGTGRCTACCKVRCFISPHPGRPPSNGDTIVADNHSQPQPSTSSTHVKRCFECGKSKPHVEFTASQWKKRVGTGRCITCVSQSTQWQTGSVASSLQSKACGECGVSKQHSDFSPNQWRKKVGTGRCKECVQKSLVMLL